MPRHSKRFVNSVLLLTVPSLALYPQAHTSITTIQTHETSQKALQIDSLLSYDDVLNLIDDLESGELEKRYSQVDLERINHFLANLALQGILPNEVEEERVLKNDIQELLHGEGNSYEYSFSLSQGNDYVLVPSIFYSQERIIPCKGWFSKKIDKTVRFAKKHKKALIIGTAVVVGVGVVIGVAAAVASAAPAAVGAVTAGSDKEKKDKSKQKEEQSSIPASTPSSSSSSTSEAPTLKAVMDEQISSFKETLVKEQFFQPSNSPNQELSWEENGRALGSLFAHDSLKNLEHQILDQPRLAQEIQDIGSTYSFPVPRGNNGTAIDLRHPEIDRRFSTDYTHLYATSGKEVDFNTLSYQLRGERALAYGYYNQAIHDLEKVIETNPTNPILYLERGVAHFGLGQYDRSLEDYHIYISQIQRTDPLSLPDFSLGFAKGLPNGIYESGSGLFLFLTDLVKHPINTGTQMWDAFTLLGDLARSEEWSTLSEILAPEVHQLVKEWPSLSSDRRGELAGYAFGKYGADILIPGALAKAISRGLKGTQELSRVYKGLKTAEQTLLLESVAGLGNSAKIAEIVQLEKNISSWLGEGTQFIRNKAGDPVFLSKDGLRRVRFDFNNPHGDKLHLHIEQKLEGRWQDASSQHRIYPINE